LAYSSQESNLCILQNRSERNRKIMRKSIYSLNEFGDSAKK